MTHNYKPGDVARISHVDDGISIVVGECDKHFSKGPHWHHVDGGGWDPLDLDQSLVRPLVVIDPEEREAIERLSSLVEANGGPRFGGRGVDSLVAALREFAAPKPPRPEEPTTPTARVSDRRDNTWRLLADGDWVCVDGPDIGMYAAWADLVIEFGPLEVWCA